MILDILIIILTLLFIIMGYKNGFVKSAFNLIKLVIVIYFTPIFLPMVELIANIRANNVIIRYLVYFAIFIVLYLLVSIVINMITKLIGMTPLGIVNKLLGAVFGLVKASIIIVFAIIIMLFASNKFDNVKEVLYSSILVEYISINSGAYNSLFPEFIKDKLDDFRTYNLEKNFKRKLLKEIKEGI
ncbi:CvpA family protein [Streptobacillus moniliformis]|uniref:CvpA family protein n=1 Tax=Streptobacillus moniliformis TaxID=34105 RepID=UPI0007E46724|nr:CvpA family protein [Streptobacillus moniliformis]